MIKVNFVPTPVDNYDALGRWPGPGPDPRSCICGVDHSRRRWVVAGEVLQMAGWAAVDELLLRPPPIVENDILKALNDVVDLIIGHGTFRSWSGDTRWVLRRLRGCVGRGGSRGTF